MTIAVPESSIGVVRKVLAPHFGGVHIGSKALNPRPSRFIRVSRAGGPTTWAIDFPLMIIECWSDDSVQAEQDALLADRVLRATEDYSWRGSSIVDFPDPDVPIQSRWQLTGTLGITIH